MKRLLLAALLALPTITIANPVLQDPMPSCFPCPVPPPDPDPDGIVAVVLPSDAR
jgi:hypothetical protein